MLLTNGFILTDEEYKQLVQLVPNRHSFTTEPTIPWILTVGVGEKTPTKVKFINKLISEWVMSIKRVSGPDPVTKCPYPQASSLNTTIRTFFAALQNIYQWSIKAADLKGFPGCFHGQMKDLYEERIAAWVSRVNINTRIKAGVHSYQPTSNHLF
jgi:hypothetical protein